MLKGQVRVALVNAPPYAHREPRYDTPRFTRLSLAALAGHLRDHGHDQLLLIDAKYERIGYQEIQRRLADFQPDVVGLTAFTNEVVQCGHVARSVRLLSQRLGKRIVTVMGGPHCSALPEQTLRELPQLDLVVVGQGEAALLELIEHLASGGTRESLASIAGIAFRDGPGTEGPVVRTRPRTTTGPGGRPAWDLLPPSPVATVMTARGCPYACNFCQNPNGRRVRKRDEQEFLDEVRYLVRERGVRELFICDEIFSLDRARTHRILDGLIELGFGRGLTFEAQTHVNCVDEALLRKIDSAGCTMLGFGLETGDPDTLLDMGKGANPQRVQEAIAEAKRAGVKLGTFFILGQPDETWRSAWNTIRLAVRANPELPMFGLMVPYPGTRVWDWANRGERGYSLNTHDWNAYNKQVGDALRFGGISRRGIELMRLLGYSLVFVSNGRWSEFARFVWRYRLEGRAVLSKVLTGRLDGLGGAAAYRDEIEALLRASSAPRALDGSRLYAEGSSRRLRVLRLADDELAASASP